jgi:alkylation response protein AidB-like acyl-CoA dehydrogenase
MDFSFSAEQQMLRSSLQSFLARSYSFEARRKSCNSVLGWNPEIWKAFAEELGILSMSLPERLGGFGRDVVNTLVVMEELGRALVVGPYLETIVLCGGLLQRSGGDRADRLLEEIGSGSSILAFGWAEPGARFKPSHVAVSAARTEHGWTLDGVKSVVSAAPWASGFLVSARTAGSPDDSQGISLFWVDKSITGVELRAYPTVDGRRAADITLRNVKLSADALIGEQDNALPIIEQVMDEGIAALCAEALGVIGRLHQDTVSYTRQRHQFGQAISGFQVLQHRMVDMYLEYEMAISATYLATMKLDKSPAEGALAASAAKVTVGNACRMIGQNAVQLHGGMGMTDDLALGHYFKRATVIESEFGSVDFHLARFAGLSHSD